MRLCITEGLSDGSGKPTREEKMSKSKEGMDQKIAGNDPNTERDLNQPAGDELNRKLGARGQTDYTSGRESSRDFPRRSTSMRYRQENFQQRSLEPERTNLYNQQQRTDYRQSGRYEDLRSPREDTDNPYSRSNRERLRGSNIERQRMRGGDSEPDRQYRDPYRSYERGRQAYDNQSFNRQQNPSDYSNQSASRRQNQPDYGNQQWNQQRLNRQSTTRDFGTPDYGSPDYGSQAERSPRFDQQNYGSQNYPARSYNPRQYNPERRVEDQREVSGQEFESRNEPDNRGYDREDRYSRGYENLGSPQGFDMPYYDANAVGYDWQGRPYEGYRYTLRCRDIMTKDVTCCTPDTTIRNVAEQMEDDNVGSIPVVENGRLIGLVTDRDIVCRILAEGKDTRSTVAREAMSDDIVTCAPDESVMEAIRKMSEHQIRRIPICDLNGRLRGIISIGDIALEAERDRDIACALEKISEPTPYQSHRR
jgi:CBS domain-containing protein